MKPIIRVENLSKQYRIGANQASYSTLRDSLANAITAPFRRFTDHRPPTTNHHSDTIWALKDINFEVQPGEVVGIIGRNGAGKSTLLKILSRITEPTTGKIDLHGRVSSLLEVGTGFHPELTGRENIYLNGAVLGMKRAEITRKFDEIVAFAEIEKFLDTPVKHYSSGMYMRLAFSVAAHLEPEILIVDEVLAVGDAAFQKKCLGKMSDVAKEGRTVLFVSHNIPAILNLCNRGVFLEHGQTQMIGSAEEVVTKYLAEADDIKFNGEAILSDDRPHPQTELRFRVVRILDDKGQPTELVKLSKGCRISIEYEILQPVNFAQVAFELWNSLGEYVLCSTDLDDIEPEKMRMTKYPGRYVAHSFIESQYLRPGVYWVDLGSSIPNIRMLDEVHRAISFEVVDDGSFMLKLAPQSRRGVITPLLKWQNCKI